MSEPHIASRTPIAVMLEPGSYSFCTCGLSETQPFCDGAHKATTDFRSKKFSVSEKQQAYLCMCKHTQNAPYCDGSHKRLPSQDA